MGAFTRSRPRAGPTAVVRLPLPLAALARRMLDGSIRLSDINRFFDVEPRLEASVPLMLAPAVCGFPSPAEDYLDRPLDFNELLIDNLAATFAVRIKGLSMIKAGLFPDDIAVVNRALEAVDGCVVLALLDGEFTVKRYRRKGQRVWLQAEGPGFADIEPGENAVLEIWGVITRSIRMTL